MSKFGNSPSIPKAWHQKQGLTGSAVAPWPLRSPSCTRAEKFKRILAKALNLILDGGSQSPQIARPLCPLLGTHLLQGLIT